MNKILINQALAILERLANAGNGLKIAFSETSMRINTTLAVVVILVGFLTDYSVREWIVIILCIGLVLGAETLNTSIEHICNFIQPNMDDEIRKIKDLTAGAVLILATSAAAIYFIILFI